MMSRRFLVSRRPRRGFTLVEILVAAAISLIVMLAVVQLFKYSSDIVREGRATIEMAGQIRRAAQQVREDLTGLTVPTTPWPSDATAQGYFEYYEGPQWDGQTVRLFPTPGDTNPNNDVFGDLDDVIMFTARSGKRPFVGRYFDGTNTRTIESKLAEIVIWTVPRQNGEALLYRRVLLIRPDLSSAAVAQAQNQAALVNFYNNNDLSVRVERSTGNLFLNSLADLTKRENRVAHVFYNNSTLNAFPFPLNPVLLKALVQTGTFQGNDVLLDHVTSFDVKLYDPIALIRRDAKSGRALEPSDPGYAVSAASTSPVIQPIGQGAYVDLGYGQYTVGASRFSGLPHVKSRLNPNYLPKVNGRPYGRTFCTWSSHYERDGINQNGNYYAGPPGPDKTRPITDEGTDGIDNDGANGVDDAGELETTPPYPFPLRSLQIKIRIMDSVTQKVRQVTVQNDFFAE